MNIKPLATILIALSLCLSAAAQEEKQLDCSASLNPQTPYNQTLLGCPIANTPNNVAARALSGINFGGNAPTVKQCELDLASWKQAGSDWYAREKTANYKTFKEHEEQNPRPITQLSTDELYRRSYEAGLCTLYIGLEPQRLRKEAKKVTPLLLDRMDTLREEREDMLEQHTEILGEQLSRAEHVVDRHFAWGDLRNQKD